LSENIQRIIENFEVISYPLYNILTSDKSLEECNECCKITDMSQSNELCDFTISKEMYILYTLSSLLDRAPIENRFQAKQKILKYTKYFDGTMERAS
jgi:hypothetical protein